MNAANKFARGAALAALFCALPLRAPAQTTEGPGTIGPGRVLLETDLWARSQDRHDGERIVDTYWGATVVSTGLRVDLDLQVGLQPHVESELEGPDGTSRTSGIGDLFLGAKWSFLRDEAHGLTFAAMPYLKLPTAAEGLGNDHLEGGLVLPFEKVLTGSWTLGGSASLDLVRNESDDGYASSGSGTVFLGLNATGRIFLYGEGIASIPSAGSTAWMAGLGASYAFSEFLSLDYEYMDGLNEAAQESQHALRLTWEF